MEKKKNNNKIKLSLLLPVRNEGVNLKIMLKILKATIDVPHEVLVVYDSLDDDSIPVVKEMQKIYPEIMPVHNNLGRGVANAIKVGIKSAAADYILIITADDIGPVLAVDDMITLMDEGCDLVSATRYANGGRILGGLFISRFLSKITNKLFYIVAGSALTDSTIGIKMLRRSIFDKINLEANPIGWAVTFELAIKAQRAGLKLGEVPIISINRFYGGKSSFKLGTWAKEYSKWFLRGMWYLYRSGKRRRNIALKIPTKSAQHKK